MEKGTDVSRPEIIRVVLTGPECTGKSTLARQLASHYHTLYIPEYAREYISGLKRPYTYADVLHIAKTQVQEMHEYSRKASGILFLDTYLIITRVWFDVVYHRSPAWIGKELSKNDIQLYLLCDTDIEWEPDPVRENGGARREYLLTRYKNELVTWGCNYRIISGIGDDRLQHAIEIVNSYIQIRNTLVK